MATIAQLNKQIDAIAKQKDVMLVQVNKLEQQVMNLRKQKESADESKMLVINKQLADLSMKIQRLTGEADVTIQEDDEGITTTTIGDAIFPMKFGNTKKEKRYNTMDIITKNESIYKFVDAVFERTI